MMCIPVACGILILWVSVDVDVLVVFTQLLVVSQAAAGFVVCW